MGRAYWQTPAYPLDLLFFFRGDLEHSNKHHIPDLHFNLDNQQ
jgi:hypothetical protein